MAACPNRLTVIHQLASSLSPSQMEQLKLARLRELRSTIDALRGGFAAGQGIDDPLLAWAISQEHADHARKG